MDSMYIRDLAVECVIGTRPAERTAKQRLLINIEIECDLREAGTSDRLEDTINYSELRRRILAEVEPSRFYLIEKVADVVARICLENERAAAVTVTVDKPAALDEARSAAVRIRRQRSG